MLIPKKTKIILISLSSLKDFLRKEFSYENLQFFLTLQEFKKLTNREEVSLPLTCLCLHSPFCVWCLQIEQKANDIYNTYISANATEPVNVDSKARKSVDLLLKTQPSTRVFALAEKQVPKLFVFFCRSKNVSGFFDRFTT